ncbi:hypothetical protein OAI24_03100 [Alphaproteobacteria bacterium]|nr:hypothetical protein [Alphaproteobacteria bacterium]
MTRILTIIALLFVTPALAAKLSFGQYRLIDSSQAYCGVELEKQMGPDLWGNFGCVNFIKTEGMLDWQEVPNYYRTRTLSPKISSSPSFEVRLRGKLSIHVIDNSAEFAKRKEAEKLKRRPVLEYYKTLCAEYGYAAGSKELADCVKDLDIAAKQNEVLGQMKTRMEHAEQEAEAARRQAAAAQAGAVAAQQAAQQAGKEASRAGSRAIINSIINSINASNAQGKANQAYRNSNRALTTDPFGVNGCNIAGGCAKR